MTADQRQASDPAASAWVGASAGTGKTHVLTGRVLRLMLGGTPPDKILCLTFTKAAAAEMSNRIHESLARWVTADDTVLARQIAALQDHAATAAQCHLARQLFAQVLDVPGGLKIQTIHSFCQSLLARFPVEAGEPPHFQVLDDRTTAEHLRAAQDNILLEARAQPRGGVARALELVSRKGTEIAFAELVRELVRERAQLERLLGRFTTFPGLTVAMRRALGLEASTTYRSIITEAVADGAFAHAALLMASGALIRGTKTDIERGAAISAWLAADQFARVGMFDAYKKAYLTAKGLPLARLATKGVVDSNPAVEEVLRFEAERLVMVTERLKLVQVAENTVALLTLAQGLLHAFAESKRRHAVLDYDDLILATCRLLTTEGIAPWVLFKLDGGIDHILIDEAQDTNPEQWQVVQALADEFFTGNSSREIPRTIFAVGDVKQSIYSFQRADPREFQENRRRFSGRAAAVGHEFRGVELSLSFRSTAAVLALVDEVFTDAQARDGLSFEETVIRHEAERLGHAGLVEIWPPELPDEMDEERDWTPPTVQEQSTEPEARLAVRIAAQIAGWLRNGEMLTARGRPIRAGDIMVLVRRRTAFVDYLIRALKLRNVAVAGSDRMVLTDQLGVMDLMALARFALLPDDDLNLAIVLKSPLIGWTDDELYALAYNRGSSSLWSMLSAKRDRAYDYLARLLAGADFMPPFEFFSQLLERPGAIEGFNGRQALVARLGEDANDPIDEFLSQAMAFEQSHAPSLQGFLGWLEAGQAEIKRDLDQGRDQVRIMTVHGSKGLQAPIVFLPDTTQTPKQGARLIWADVEDKLAGAAARMVFWPGGAENEVGICAEARAEMKQRRDQEQRRLLYVALTRAEDRLYVAGWENAKGRDTGCWYNLVESAFERLPGVVNVAVGAAVGDYIVRRYQTEQTVAPKDKSVAVACEVKAAALPVWTKLAAPQEPVPARPLSPSRPMDDEPALPSPLRAARTRQRDDQRFRRGRLIHRLLESLPDMAPDRRMAAARRYLSQAALALSEAEISQIAGEVMAVMSAPGTEALFGPQARAEVSIAGLVEGTAIAGQVDRLAVTDDEVIIVDYKTNRPPPLKAEDTPVVYLKQMAAYQRTLQAIYPARKVTCALLWTDGPQLMLLPDRLMANLVL